MSNFLLRNPWARAFIPLFMMGIMGVSSSALIVEISSGEAILWKKAIEKPSLYAIAASIILSAIYQVVLMRYDNKVASGFTPKQYEANIRNRVAEDVASRTRKLIREGNIKQLEDETEAFKRLFGEGGS